MCWTVTFIKCAFYPSKVWNDMTTWSLQVLVSVIGFLTDGRQQNRSVFLARLLLQNI